MLGFWILVVFCVCLLFLFIRIQRPKNFPPGPRPIPVFGNLFHFNIKNPLKDFEKLGEQYGKIYSLYIGTKPAVVLNGLKAIKEALVTKSADFSDRPQNLHKDVHAGRGVIMADYGTQWKEHRRFALMTLRNFGMGKQSMENRILGEIEKLVTKLEEFDGSSLCPQTLFHDAVSNIIYLLLFATRFDYGDETPKVYVRLFDENAKLYSGTWAMIYDALPGLKSWPLPFKKAFDNNNTMKIMTINMINKHKTTRVPGQPRDFVDCYLDDLDKRGNESTFSEEQLVAYILNLHIAGTQTTSNTLLTAILYLMAHPDIQKRCQQEIDEIMDGKSQASFEDRHNMPYTQAMIHECLRVADITPLSVFHCTTRDTELMNYTIPKKASGSFLMILTHQTSLMIKGSLRNLTPSCPFLLDLVCVLEKDWLAWSSSFSWLLSCTTFSLFGLKMQENQISLLYLDSQLHPNHTRWKSGLDSQLEKHRTSIWLYIKIVFLASEEISLSLFTCESFMFNYFFSLLSV
ncbi:cytochrome P450 2F2-like isoform X1 [Clarias gariepinus]|uniref:cytochrome P450 2F2-like isoform X1 n=1 Tax=Clarias gariepinus TaxID=13013 RepID=UPI00234D75CB|nr:cytochrome P450 2F2-like isoform X1 [Clarias gariepinus]